MERRHEIKAAQQRLALAKSHESYMSNTLQSAIAAEEAAKQYRIEIELQMQQSKKQVNEAVKLVEEVEKRLELVDDDDDDQDKTTKKLVHRESNSNENGSSSRKDQDQLSGVVERAALWMFTIRALSDITTSTAASTKLSGRSQLAMAKFHMDTDRASWSSVV